MTESIGKQVHSISMNTVEVSFGRIRWLFLAFVLAVLTASAQNAKPTDQSSPAQTPMAPQSGKPQTGTQDEDHDVKITPRQAEELFHSVDEILEFDSKQTGLPIKHEVKRKLTSRDEVVAYLTNLLNDEDTRRLRRS